MTIRNSTIMGNYGYSETQIGNAGDLRLTNTMIVGSSDFPECSGSSAVTSNGHNLHTDGSCSPDQFSDIPFGRPGLLAIADNGGIGRTHALAGDSEAIDRGNCSNGLISIDQRGMNRPQGSACDIGAFEADAQIADAADNQAGDLQNDQDSDQSSGAEPSDDSSDTETIDSDQSGANEPAASVTGVNAEQAEGTNMVQSADRAGGGALFVFELFI